MKVFIAGICGTFMAGIAQIAKALGHSVHGCDANIYPPMSDVLAAAGIEVKQGYVPDHIEPDTDIIIIGNALSRGNPLVEHVLDHKLRYQSGPAWLSDNVLLQRQVIAVAGTHGKTSTASMVAWILEQAGYKPGFLIGGKPGNFEASARLGSGAFFVIEADEYDTAFFDKRSKFVHYQPTIAVLNNLEFDHADIFDDIGQIKRQFHHLVRIIPSSGSIVVNKDDKNLADVLAMGSWSAISRFSTSDTEAEWGIERITADASHFKVLQRGQSMGHVIWPCIGDHNMANALAAIAACHQAGVGAEAACNALAQFKPSARRLQLLYQDDLVCLYEDFAHHPTAIAITLDALRKSHPDAKLIAIVEPRSNTMQMAHHSKAIGPALAVADHVILYLPKPVDWDANALQTVKYLSIINQPDKMIAEVSALVQGAAVIVAMSNGSFDGIPGNLKKWLSAK